GAVHGFANNEKDFERLSEQLLIQDRAARLFQVAARAIWRHRATLESGARDPPHSLEVVHSRLRAAQVVPWRHAYSNRLLVGDHARWPPAGSPHFLSSLIETSRS